MERYVSYNNLSSAYDVTNPYSNYGIYMQVRVSWMENNLPGYFALCKYWASPKFIKMSKKRREN
jgi:hypothetical protein